MRLFDFILQNMEPILLEWEAFARAVQPRDRRMDVAELRDHAEDMLRVIAEDMQAPQTENERFAKSKGERDSRSTDSAAQIHAEGRLDSGFSISLLASEYRALRASVLKLWSHQGHCNENGAIEDIIRFNEAIDQSLTESVERYSAAVSMQQDVFIGILGHDLRTPLQSLSHGAQYLKHTAAPDSKLGQLGVRMYKSVRRMTGMIDNLLDFTKSRVGGGINLTLQEGQLSAVAEQVIDEFRSYNPDRYFRYRNEGNCFGEWDPGHLAQVFQNLIANALQYGTKEKPVTVRTQGRHNAVFIHVHNFGSPITKAGQQKLFDLFHRHAHAIKDGGVAHNLGLGLYIVREIAIAHGGSVHVNSSKEGGTEFTVRLPKRQQRS